MYRAIERDIHCFPCLHIPNEAEAENVERHAFRGEHELVATGRLSLADHQRPDAVSIAKADQAVVSDHGNRRIAPPAALVEALHGVEHILFRRLEFPPLLQLMGKYVQQ